MKRTLHSFVATGLSAAALAATSAAQAHEGHGLPGTSHWHASDTLGLLLVVVLAAGALWLGRRK